MLQEEWTGAIFVARAALTMIVVDLLLCACVSSSDELKKLCHEPPVAFTKEHKAKQDPHAQVNDTLPPIVIYFTGFSFIGRSRNVRAVRRLDETIVLSETYRTYTYIPVYP